jgi:hypothetical protein
MQKNFIFMAAAMGVVIGQANVAHAEEAAIPSYRIAAIKWEYKPMAKAAAFYEENRARYAPDSSLRFRLPKQLKGVPEKQALRLLGPDYSDEIVLDDARTFALPALSGRTAGDTAVVVDGYFNKGSYLLPVPEVRSATLAPHMLRVGDTRLTCRTQIAYVRAYKMALNLLIGSLGAFSLDICADKRNGGYPVKAPIAYNKVTWLDGDRIVKVETLPKVEHDFRAPVGDDAVSNDVMLAFELVPNEIPAEQENKADR